jgi:hypothetical protein
MPFGGFLALCSAASTELPKYSYKGYQNLEFSNLTG